MSSLLTPRLRFRLWQLAIAAILLGMPVWFFLLRGRGILDSDRTLFSGWVLFSLLILGIWLLLLTTPPDAIKLPVRRSRWVILIGVLWLHANTIFWLSPSDGALRFDHAEGSSLLLPHLVGSGMMFLATGLLVSACVRADRSPWYAALVGWHPLTIISSLPHQVAVGILIVSLMIWGWGVCRRRQ